jgi:hypothetical protein
MDSKQASKQTASKQVAVHEAGVYSLLQFNGCPTAKFCYNRSMFNQVSKGAANG